MDLAYCFEIEFMVAQQRDGHDYGRKAVNSDDGRNSPGPRRWACPANAVDPLAQTLAKCKHVLSNQNMSVIIRQSDEQSSLQSWQAACFNSWVLRPCHAVSAGDGSPKEYNWIGIKLRSPLLPATDHNLHDPAALQCLKVLQDTTWIYVNSTCTLSISLRPMNRHMSLLQAKRLTTLVWMIEKKLLLHLSPYMSRDAFGRPLLVSAQSAIAKAPRQSVDEARTADPLLAGIMDRHLPRSMDDSALVEKLNRVWACSSVRQLSQSLYGSNGYPLAFALNLYDNGAGDGSESDSYAMASFRYAIWHPHQDVDATPLWADLALRLGTFMTASMEDFKQVVLDFGSLAAQGSSRDAGQSPCWKRFMDILGFSENSIMGWERVIAEYDAGGKLAPDLIDCQPPLGG